MWNFRDLDESDDTIAIFLTLSESTFPLFAERVERDVRRRIEGYRLVIGPLGRESGDLGGDGRSAAGLSCDAGFAGRAYSA